MNEGINLLDPNKNTGPALLVRRLYTMRIITVGLLFIISVSSVILFILVALSPLPALQKQQQTLQQTLAQSKSDIVKLALVNSQTDAISRVITQRQMLDVPIELVQNKLPDDAQITEIRSDNKSMVVTVESSSLQSIDTLLNGLLNYVQEKKSFSKITLVDLTTDESNGAYAATVQLNLL